MDNKNIMKLNMVQNVNAVYLEDSGRIIEFIGDEIKYSTKEDEVRSINIYYRDADIKQDIEKLLNIKNDDIRNKYGFVEVFLHGEIYHNTNVYKIYSITISEDDMDDNFNDVDILIFRLHDDGAYTD
ncbi:hypothetical protein [Proteiniborus sp. MB09-C3]|uniref:hypothetical protein n=1 Tax=Proteiniborus sp. MB09-C3 TaxID=3050072 RepID=UPI002553E413|nr:hypothetical protein [Proteiniborus sp. MB09-C3]WIV13218.1 hypothetical protein QO263_05780 [Proteiniborus sp. MB09-C3]